MNFAYFKYVFRFFILFIGSAVTALQSGSNLPISFRLSQRANGYQPFLVLIARIVDLMFFLLQVSGLMDGDMDVFSHNKNMQFTTKDSDNDIYATFNCAATHNRGGFWYQKCSYFIPNGVWIDEANSYTPVANGWVGIREHTLSPDYTLNSTLMMIKPAADL